MDVTDQFRYSKVDETGELVDMRELTNRELKHLLEFYQKKLKRARVDDMVKAYTRCVDQIGQFMYGGKVSGPPDVFTQCRVIGNIDVRSFIRTYLGIVKSDEELAQDKLIKHFESRNVLYTGAHIPTDDAIRDIFKTVAVEQPPAIDKVASIFTSYYGVNPVKVKLLADPECGVVFYDFEFEMVIVNPEQVQVKPQLLYAVLLGLFEHVCAKKSWRFSVGGEECFVKQREETTRFVERFFSRCSEIGLMPPL